MPGAVLIPAIATAVAGGAAAGASIYGAKKQASTANTAATLQSADAARALAFDKQQAENSYQNSEATRKANYDQWAATQTAHNAARAKYGYVTSAIPAYVPGVDPGFTAAPSGDPRLTSPALPLSPPSVGATLTGAAPLPTSGPGTASDGVTPRVLPSVGTTLAAPPMAAPPVSVAPIITDQQRALYSRLYPSSVGSMLGGY